MAAIQVEIRSAFTKENQSKKLRFAVKILGEVSSNKFLVADPTGNCTMELDSPKPAFMKYITAGSFVRIINPRIDVKDKKIILHGSSSIFKNNEIKNVQVPTEKVEYKSDSMTPSGSKSVGNRITKVPPARDEALSLAKRLDEVIALPAGKVILRNFVDFVIFSLQKNLKT